jgi:pyruvate kinase
MIDIYGTLGPSCSNVKTLEEMFDAGMTGIRVNLSHAGLRESADRMELLHTAARARGITPQILIDLQGPELRVGRLKEPVGMKEGEEVLLGEGGIPVPSIVLENLREGNEILMDDGRLLLKVSAAGEKSAWAKVLRGGILQSRKSIAVHGVKIHPPTMTEEDKRNIRDALSFGVTGIMQPFVRSRQDLVEVKAALKEAGAGGLTLIAKIENREGMRKLPELLQEADMICIARGDLGNDMDLWDLPAAQKEISKACNEAGVPYFVATQMLTSMEERAVPTRAEVSDIFNTAADGASGVMITGESAVGKYPVEAIRYLANTARAGEEYRKRQMKG